MEQPYAGTFTFPRTPAEIVGILTPDLLKLEYHVTTQSPELVTF